MRLALLALLLPLPALAQFSDLPNGDAINDRTGQYYQRMDDYTVVGPAGARYHPNPDRFDDDRARRRGDDDDDDRPRARIDCSYQPCHLIRQ